MRRFFLTGAIALIVATPAMARDNSAYVGIEAGALFPRSIHANVDVRTFTGVTVGSVDNAFTLHHKTGVDVDAIGGYDFGMFRVEGELAWKHAGVGRVDNFNPALISDLSTATGVPVTATALDLDGHVSALSGMLNGLVDFGGDGGVGGYVGGGVGLAGVKYNLGGFHDRDNGFAWQLLAGVYMPVSSNIDVGLKYRYFRPKAFDFNSGQLGYAGAGAQFVTDLSGRFSSHSILASLVYNLAAAAPPPPPSPPPPPPPPPAAQTCPDGSVIPVTSACPAPPPAPPPPPAPVERGERGF